MKRERPPKLKRQKNDYIHLDVTDKIIYINIYKNQ